MVFCESWLYDDVSDDEVSIPQYYGIRCDRRGGKRGGSVCVYVKNGICFRSIIASLQIPSCIEALWLHIIDTSVTLLAIYIPPGLSSNNTKSSTVELLPACYYLAWHPITCKLTYWWTWPSASARMGYTLNPERLRTVPCSRHKATLTRQKEREQKRVSFHSLRTVIHYTGDRGHLAAGAIWPPPCIRSLQKFFGFLVSVHVFLDVNNGQAKIFVSFLQIFFENTEKRQKLTKTCTGSFDIFTITCFSPVS